MTGSLASLVTVTVGAVMSATNRELVGRLARTVSGSTFPSRRAGWQLERGRAATWFLLRSLHRFSAFQVAGRRCVSLAFSARRRLVALHDLLLVVQEHAAQRPPESVAGASFVDVVRDPSRP